MPATTAPLTLIHGEDDFAVKQRAKALFHQWSEELGGMDHETIDAAAANSGEALKAVAKLHEALNTLPFFGGGKAVWFKDCNFLAEDRTSSSASVTAALGELAETLKKFKWGDVRLVISAVKVDKRKVFYKAVEKTGAVETFAGLSLDDRDWADQAEALVRREFRERKKEPTDEAAAALVETVGPNVRQLISEVEKLSLYLGDRRELTEKDVADVAIKNKHARAFALGDAVGDRDLPKALRTLDEELWGMQFDKDKSEIGLLYGLISKLRLMLLLKEMTREGWIRAGSDANSLKSQLERIPAEKLPEDRKYNPKAMHPFMLSRALKQSENYTTAELVRGMELLLSANLQLVSANTDEKVVLQQTLVQIASGPKPRAGRAAA